MVWPNSYLLSLLVLSSIMGVTEAFSRPALGILRQRLNRVALPILSRASQVRLGSKASVANGGPSSDSSSVLKSEGASTFNAEVNGLENEESLDDYEPESVSMSELVKFGLPTLAIWLLQPLLSLIDSSVVGMSRSATVAEFAGLGPGIAWVDSTSYLMNFLGIAVTNLYAYAFANNDHDECWRVLRSGKSMGYLLSFVLLFVQLTLARHFIGILAGPNLDVIPYAMKYARIRALGAIAAVPTIVIQAAFLASKDSVTPLVAVVVGAMVNLVGDIMLVNGFGLGIVGAAWATMLSQFASFIYLLRSEYKLRKNVVTSVAVRVPIEAPTENDVVRLGKDIDPETGAVSITMSVNKKGSVPPSKQEQPGRVANWGMAKSMSKSRARLLGDGSGSSDDVDSSSGSAEELEMAATETSLDEALKVLEATVERSAIGEATAQATTITATLIEDLPRQPVKEEPSGFYFPSRKEFGEYFSFCGPVFCILLLKTSLWNSTTVAVAPSGAAALAAHQILINFFLYFVIFGDVLNQCSQTYLPALIKRTKKNIMNSFQSARKLVITMLKLSAILGVINSMMGVLLVKYAVGSITPSREIHQWAISAVLGFALTILPHSALSSFEGVIITTRDIKFQSIVYAITSTAFVAYQNMVQKRNLGLKYVWYGFAIYQWLRLAVFSLRVSYRMRRARRQGKELELASLSEREYQEVEGAPV